eukprot:TRINITY_DN7245_c0_g1_i1.p1 TRINITY_DN7245_c0_g1~~TRINITY_DN7245_c0_g1_i1.p1  ORF type:complete len:375 (+),score=20.83 TRINITY_DN7245_c0_g1_i1:51-1175(+)
MDENKRPKRNTRSGCGFYTLLKMSLIVVAGVDVALFTATALHLQSSTLSGSRGDFFFGSLSGPQQSKTTATTTAPRRPGQLLPPLSSNSSLVIIMGNFRGGELSWKTLYENVLDPNSADLALIVGEPAKGKPAVDNSLLKRAKYTWYFPEYEDWADAVDLINGTGWRNTTLRLFYKKVIPRMDIEGIFGGMKHENKRGSVGGSGMIIFMIRWFLSQHLKEEHVLQKYETFVLTRADHYYHCPHMFTEFDLTNKNVWVPKGQEFGGVTDRHLVVSRENVLNAIDVYPSMLRSNFTEYMKGVSNPEKLVMRTYASKGLDVRKFDRVMYTCATPTDTTRFQRGVKELPGVPGLKLKYPSEYSMTLQNRKCVNEHTNT